MAGMAGSDISLEHIKQINYEGKDLMANQEILYRNIQYYIIQLLLDIFPNYPALPSGTEILIVYQHWT